jgi:hypothetical protein
MQKFFLKGLPLRSYELKNPKFLQEQPHFFRETPRNFILVEPWTKFLHIRDLINLPCNFVEDTNPLLYLLTSAISGNSTNS